MWGQDSKGAAGGLDSVMFLLVKHPYAVEVYTSAETNSLLV